MADMSVSGIASGIDWDSMIEKILETARKPAYVQLNKRDNLELKKSLFEEFQVALQAVQRSLSSLKLPSTYTAKGVDIARLDNNTSHKSVLTATANADAEIDLHTVEVAQIAKAQISRSNTFSPSTALGAAAAGSFNINVGGRTFTINVGAADTLQNISDNINQLLKTQIPPVGITASVLFDRLILQSDSTGMGSTTITSNTMTTSNGAVIFADGAGNPYTPPIDMSHGVAKVNVGGAIYTQGKDFDILAGNQIVWRTTIPSVATTGDTYQLECQLNAGSIYTNAITRGSGKIDDNALPVSASPLNPSDIKIQSMGGSPYEYRSGVDYIIGGADGRDIEWLDGGLRPPAGVAYEIVYTAPTGGPNITVDVKRNNTDTIATPFATLDPVVVDIVDSAGRIYKRGVDFELAQDPS
ncbi:MAG: hypothetical protein LBD04_10585, partial [Synergistaceae bacterium]|nr:hypothetical protein [Synergistaceae bacterium]